MDAMSGTDLNRFDNRREGEGRTGEEDGVPVVRQEDPGGKEKMVPLSPFAEDAGQAVEFGFPEPAAMGKEAAGDEKEAVGHHPAAQARHGAELYAQSHGYGAGMDEPQSLWTARLRATPADRQGAWKQAVIRTSGGPGASFCLDRREI